MKFTTTALATILSAGFATAANSQDVAFLTALVSDFASNKREYIQFLATAESFPAQITQLAALITTYTDDSYTTLLDESSLDISSLESYATNLPWYSRLAEDADITLTSDSARSTGAGDTSATSSSDSSTSSSTTANGGGSLLYCSTGAVVGALALLLL